MLKKVISTTCWLLQFEDVPLFPRTPPCERSPRHFISCTHRVRTYSSHFSTPHGGSYPGESITDEGARRRVQLRRGEGKRRGTREGDRGSAGCGVGGGTRSGGAWLRLRHATSTRPSSPPSSYLVSRASSRHLTAATSLAATTPDPDPLLPSMSLLPFLPLSRSRGRTLLPLPDVMSSAPGRTTSRTPYSVRALFLSDSEATFHCRRHLLQKRPRDRI